MKSKVHPKFKTKYRVGNWPEYEQRLVRRGDLTVWVSADAIDTWSPASSGRRGGQREFSDVAIETALTLRLVFRLPLRQTEGFVRSILALLDLDLDAPDHTTLSRRGRALEIDLHRLGASGPVHLVVDSTGLSIVGDGEWAAVRNGGRGKRGWRKLHLGVDATGSIVAVQLTGSTGGDAGVVPSLLDEIPGEIGGFTADAAYDSRAVYAAAEERGATVVVPPTRSAVTSQAKRRPEQGRDATVARVREVGMRSWKKESGYYRQARVENTFFRYKRAFGGRLRARCSAAQEVEVRLACSLLNRFTGLGSPESFPVGA